ncbi:hypothetical protein FRB99_005877 [Tulasnella sp. 403]|nr:hypothetical protein FRB99_005877 [Tulasnella sp. 403]
MLLEDAPSMHCVGVNAEEFADGHLKVQLVFAPTTSLTGSNYNLPRLPIMSSTDLVQPDDINDLAASVRRHHTISSSHRPPRSHHRIPISEVENEDEVVGSDWVGGVGVVGEGKGLHRQSSLPSKYSNRGSRHHGAASGTITPSRNVVNSLSAITAEHGAEGEEQEEEFWNQMRDWRGDEELPASSAEAVNLVHLPNSQVSQEHHSRSLSQSSHSSSISPMLSEEMASTTLAANQNAGAGVRRHQSLTYGHGHSHTAGGARSLMRSATIGKTSRASTLNSRAQASDVPAIEDAYFPGGAPDDADEEAVISPASNSTGHGSAGHGRSWATQSSSGNTNTSAVWGLHQQSVSQTSAADDIEDVQRKVAALEIDGSSASGQLRSGAFGGYYPGMYGSSQTLSQPPANPNHTRKLSPPPSHPPRFRSPSPNGLNESPYASTVASAALKSPNVLQAVNPASQVTASTGRSPIHKLSLVTNIPQTQGGNSTGPVSAAAYVPPPGGGLPLGEELGSSAEAGSGDTHPTPVGPGARDRDKPLTATGVTWDQKDRILGSRIQADLQAAGFGNASFNPATIFTNPAMFASFDPTLQQQLVQHFQNQALQQQLQQSQAQSTAQGFMSGAASAASLQFQQTMQTLQMMQQQLLQQQLLQTQQLYAPPPHGQYAQPQSHGLPSRVNPQIASEILLNNGLGSNGNGSSNWNASSAPDPENPLAGSFDMQALMTAKGYNPTTFDTKPPYARFFVIKSYTEDDVHKSLKYEIWSSTEPGNKRLDKAFKETNGRGPIYLFFSVNASGHFCGVAEMLTPVDYTRSSTVWAQDKWKGVIKVKWIFVRDVPNSALRHIRLNNTQEMKPVTNSRDTQELLPEAGHEMLRIFLSHPSKTSLLQDFAFYELQAMQKQSTGQILTAAQPQPAQQGQFRGQGSNPTSFSPTPIQMLSQQQQQQQQVRQGVNSPPPRQPSATGFSMGSPSSKRV